MWLGGRYDIIVRSIDFYIFYERSRVHLLSLLASTINSHARGLGLGTSGVSGAATVA